MKKVCIEFGRITPRVLKAYYYSDGKKCEKRHELKERTVYDYETELITYSDGGMYIDGIYYSVSRGDIIFRRPGQTTRGVLPYTCYAVILDLMNNTGKDSGAYDFHRPQELQQDYSCPALDRIPPVIKASSFERYSILFDAILKEYINPGPDSETLLRAFCLQLLCSLSRESLRPAGCQQDGAAYRSMIKNVIDYVEQNISKRIMLKDLAAVAGMSPNYFHRVFSKSMGMTPNEFVISRKMSRARELLATTGESVTDISLMCGFDNVAYFSYVFRRYSGITPSSFRAAYSYPAKQA